MRFLVFLVLCASLYFLGQSVLREDLAQRGASASGQAAQIWTLPEMDEIPQTKDWKPNRELLSPSEGDVFQQLWSERYPAIVERVTPALVEGLSRWGKDEMFYYREPNIPEAERVFWLPVARDETGQKVLLEATLEPLPAPRTMRRDLKLFALFDTEKKRIYWILITIRSETR